MATRAERSRITYNQMAEEYDTSPEGRYTRPHKAELVKKAAVSDGDRVLDVACGNGSLLRALSKKAKVHVFGVDCAENMIAAAKERCPEGTFSVGPCAPLPFDDGSMNVIMVSCAFHHFENPCAFAEECMRILKPGGMVYMAEPFFTPVIRFIANTVVFPFSKSGDVKVYSPRELGAFFKMAGFHYVETEIKGPVLCLTARA